MKKAIISQTKSGKQKGQWRFKLIGDNGEAIATSGTERYHNKGDAVKVIKKYFGDFEIVVK